MTKRFPPPVWNKPSQADKGYPIHAGTPLGPRSERPPSDVLMIGSTPNHNGNKRPNNEVSSSSKKRKTSDREEVLKKKLKAGRNGSGRSRQSKPAPATSRLPRTPIRKTPVKPVADPGSAITSRSSKSRSSRQWHTPPPLPSETEMLKAMGKSAYDGIQQELLKAKRMRSTSRQDNKEDYGPVESHRSPLAPMQLPHTRNVEIEMQTEDQQDAADVSADLMYERGPGSTEPHLETSNPAIKTAEWYRRSRDRAEADANYKFKVAICPAYDIFGDLCKVNKCINGDRCNFAHPEDEEWATLVSRGVAKVRMNLACPHYDELGEPTSKGGCPQREYCPLYHPWHSKWLKLRGNGCMKSPAHIRCKHYDRHGQPISKGGCWHRKHGECNYVHPDSKHWHRAVCVTPCPSEDPDYFKEPVRGKGVIRYPHCPSWIRALPSQPPGSQDGSPELSFNNPRVDSGSSHEGPIPAANFILPSKRQASDADATGQWVSHIREGVIADAGYALARDALARHDRLLASGVSVASDPAVIAETRALTGRAIAAREALDKSLQDLQGSTAKFFATCHPSTDALLLDCVAALENSAGASAYRYDRSSSVKIHTDICERLQALEVSAARQASDTSSLYDRVDDHSRSLRSRKHLSERVYDLEDDLKDLKVARKKEKQAVADQMVALSWDIRESRRVKASETDTLKNQIKRELVAELDAYLQPNRKLAIIQHSNSQSIRPLSESSFVEGDVSRESR